jgi:catalase
MPLPSDEKIAQLANNLVGQLQTMFGKHPGFRPAHAKGILLTGTFQPAASAPSLTRAPHANRPSTPVSVRFSDSTGIPGIPDTDSNANPHGMAIRFHLADRVHTDIIGHSADGFPVRTGEEFLEMLRAVAASDPSKPSPTPIEKFLGSHPSALAYVKTPKPFHASFAQEAYFGVTAMRFVNKNGTARYGRYRITPEAGVEHLSDAAAKSKGADYLFDDVRSRLKSAPIRFRVQVQIAGEHDVVNDATIHWPADRQVIDFGTIELTAEAPNNAAEQQHVIFDPIPRVDGIEASEDPLLELRAAIYLISGRQRRAAETPERTSVSGR